MSKFKVYLSPSDQTRNTYAYGGTTEAIQCGRIAEATKKALERNGIEVMVGQYDTMANRCAASDKFGANLHVPIHTNAANGQVAGTRMFSYDYSGDGYKACKAIFNRLAPVTPGTSEVIKADPTLYEIAHPSAPTAYIEVDFHDVPEVAKWIINHTNDIAEAICHGICDYFGVAYKKAETTTEKTISVKMRQLKKGMSGNDCVMLKVMLKAKGYITFNPLANDKFGKKTKAAVQAFQKDNGIKQTGIVGIYTWKALLRK